MAMQIYNSLSRRLENFEPADPEDVSVYACGPTVYSHVTIGNWSFNLICDVFVRWLRASGYGVRFVMNITDVEDKIIRDAHVAGKDRATFTHMWIDAFFQDLDTFGCRRADAYPYATHHIDRMVEMIQALLDKGHAYAATDEGVTSIYYRIESFPTYGQLANLSQDAIRAGASGRVTADEYEKENVSDFALWKGWVPEDGDVAWVPTFRIDGEAKVYKGRPGWHIECSAMSTELLGDQIDVHLGGEDLRFPHHQNEIAQSEAATGKRPFVRYWMHRRYLLVDGKKMSKSKDNFYTVGDLIDHAGPSAPRGFRYLVATSHYRTPIDFSWAGLDAAMKTLRNLDDAYARIAKHARDAQPNAFSDEAEKAFRAAMDDDLETSGAIAAVHTLVGACNRGLGAGTLSPEDAAATKHVLDLADDVMGLGLGAHKGTLTPAQQTLVDARSAARQNKEWQESDRLRDVLLEQGVQVKDTKDGQEVTIL